MANLDRLMGLNGAVSAGEFTPGGDLVSYKGGLTEGIAAMIGQLGAANTPDGRCTDREFHPH